MRLKQFIFALTAMLLSFVSVNAQEGIVAKIGNSEYTTFANAMTDANAATGNVTVEVYGTVDFVDGMELNGSYTSITFTGKSSGAQITINQTAGGDYLTAHGKIVAFENLILAKANPAWSDNSGHMGNYFSVQGGTVTYTDCTFPNGACTNTGTAVYNNCTFQNASEYGLWVYDDALVTVNGGTIDSKKGIKVYSEGEESVTSTLTVQNATFTENVTAKPAVAIGYAESITLIGNTYNNPTGHVELDSGSDADCDGIAFVAEDSEGNDISSELTVVDRCKSSAACGVLVDGKIYITVAQAAAVATAGSNVTLLYSTTDAVEFAEGVNLTLANGVTADNVTVEVPLAGEGTEASPYLISSVADLETLRNKVNAGNSYAGQFVKLAADLTLTEAWTPIGNGTRSSKSYSGNAFKGTFDGDNKTISGLKITSTTGDDAAIGLFGVVDGGAVKNLTLNNVDINVANSDLAGGAIGLLLGGATAGNITVNGAIVGNDGVGGIVGRLVISGTIENCTNNASVTSSYGGIGGIVGKAYYEDGANTTIFASIDNCTNNGTVTAPMYVGGIVGLARANVTDCVNNGPVVGGTQTGGIIGQLIAAGTVSGNENKAKITGKNHLGGIIGDYTQSSAYTYNNVAITSNINRGELAATEQCAAIMGCNNIDGFTAMTATGNVSYYFVEGLELFGNPEDMVIDNTNKFISPAVAKIGNVEYETLAEAVAAAQSGATITLMNGEHELPLFSGKELTFVGESKEGVIVNDAPDARAQGWNGSTFHFENLTAKGATENYHGLANGVVAVTYKDCNINGLRFLYATEGVSFEDCAFNAQGVEHSFWTYGASKVTVKNSTFTYTDRAVNCYSENGAEHEADITFEGCSFTYAGTADAPAGAVEINSGSSKSIELTMNGCTAPEKGAMWFNSQWDSKKGENTVVTVDDVIVWQVLAAAKVNGVEYKSLQVALDAAAAGTGNVTVEILRDVDLTGIDWNPVTVSAPGYPVVTVEGNNKTITGLNDMLFAGTWAGGSGLIIKNLTIDESAIVNDKDDAKGTVGVGAFIGFPQASATITLENCHLKKSSVEGGHWTGGLIGYAAGYAGEDGPVFMNLTVKNCSVTGSTITGKGSVGGIIGHGSGNGWTNVVIEETTVQGNTITSTGSSAIKAGAIMGTIGAAGQPTTANGVTKTGGATVSATVAGNTVTSNGTAITTIYGRQGTSTGMLYLNGGTYDNNPIEENVAYAKPAEGFMCQANSDGTYSVVVDPAYGKVAMIGETYYETLDAAFAAAQDNDEVKIIAAGTYALTTSGKNITITATVDGVVFDNIGAKNMGGANVTFNKVTFDYYPNVNYTGLQHSGNLKYNDCIINGQVFLYGTSETFNNCTFNQNSADAYNVWTYGAKEVAFNECTFNSVGKSVLVYTESTTTTNDVTVTKCAFNASAPVEGKAAIEIDTSLSAGATITVDGATTATGFGSGNVSGNSLWNNKKGNADAANNDVTVVVNGETVLAPIPDVAKIGETGYRTLAKAIEAAQPGDVITFLQDITENVTINKNVTIDGAGKKYTGTMTANSGLTVTVQNVNFVNGGFAKTAKSTTGNYTFKDCTFDGAGTYAYPLSFGGANTINVENCTVKDYAYSFLYVRSSTVNVNVKDVTVENCSSYAVYFSSGVTTAAFEKLTVKNSNNGFVINNTAKRAFTIKDCTMENVNTAINHSNGTSDITCTVLGVNDIGGAALSEYAVINGATITGTTYYGSVKGMVEKAVTGQTVQLLSNITLDATGYEMASCDGYPSFVHVEGKAITVDLNGKTIDANVAADDVSNFVIGVFSTDNGGELTLVDNSADGTGTVVLEAEEGKVYSLLCNYEDGCKMTINGGTYKANKVRDCLVYSGGRTDAIVTVNGGNFTLGNVGAGENGKPWIFNVLGAGDHHVLVNGGTFNADINRQHWSNEVYVAKECYTVANTDGTYTVKEGAVAYVNMGMLTGPYFVRKNVGYATLGEAFAAADDDETVTLLKDITYTKETGFINGEYVDGLVYTGDKNFTVDFAGHTVTENGDINDYLVYLKNTGEKDNEITFKNGAIAINSQSTATAWAAITVGSNSSTHATTLNLDSMKVINGNPNAAANLVIRSRNGATVNLNEGTTVTSNGTSYGVVAEAASTFNINDGAKIIQQNSGTTGGNVVYTAVSGNGVINIYEGAVIESDKYGIHNMTTGNTEINIYGGTITAPVIVRAATNGGSGESADVYISGGIFCGAMEEYTNTANIHVSGGVFDRPVAEEFCAEGYAPCDNEDGTYGVYYAVLDEVHFVDGEFTEYNNSRNMTVGTLTYKRNGIPTTWTTFYVPFEVPVSQLAEQGFEVAYINGVRRDDNNFDGELDNFVMEVIYIHGGNADGSAKTLKANYPYFIRSKGSERIDLYIELEDALLYAAKNATYDCSTFTEKFEITGTIATTEVNSSDNADKYIISGGEWSRRTIAYNLAPFRFYMTVTSRDDNRPINDAPASLSIVIRGEELPDGTTLIYDINAETGDNVIYDLYGRRVLETEKGNIYIINGKKVLVK